MDRHQYGQGGSSAGIAISAEEAEQARYRWVKATPEGMSQLWLPSQTEKKAPKADADWTANRSNAPQPQTPERNRGGSKENTPLLDPPPGVFQIEDVFELNWPPKPIQLPFLILLFRLIYYGLSSRPY